MLSTMHLYHSNIFHSYNITNERNSIIYSFLRNGSHYEPWLTIRPTRISHATWGRGYQRRTQQCTLMRMTCTSFQPFYIIETYQLREIQPFYSFLWETTHKLRNHPAHPSRDIHIVTCDTAHPSRDIRIVTCDTAHPSRDIHIVTCDTAHPSRDKL